MKVTLMSVKYSPSLSDETNAFTAIVVVDGVPAFGVSNHGQGGCDEHFPLKGQSYEKMRWEMQRVEDYAKTLPPDTSFDISTPQDVESLVGEAFEDWLVINDLTKLLKKKLLFKRSDGKIYAVALKGFQPDYLNKFKDKERARDAGVVFLNDAPFETAVAIYKEHA